MQRMLKAKGSIMSYDTRKMALQLAPFVTDGDVNLTRTMFLQRVVERINAELAKDSPRQVA